MREPGDYGGVGKKLYIYIDSETPRRAGYALGEESRSHPGRSFWAALIVSIMSRTPIHPGEIFREELEYTGLSVDDAAAKVKSSKELLTGFMEGREDLTIALALDLSEILGTSPRFWFNLHDMYHARR